MLVKFWRDSAAFSTSFSRLPELVLGDLAEFIAGTGKRVEGAGDAGIKFGDHLHGIGGGFAGDDRIRFEELLAAAGGELDGGIAEDREGKLSDGVFLQFEPFGDIDVNQKPSPFGVEFDLADVSDGEAVLADGSAGEDSLGILEGDGDAIGVAEEPAGFTETEDDADRDDGGDDHEESDAELESGICHVSDPGELP